MAFYIQYDPETGFINSTVNSSGEMPENENQLIIQEGWVPTEGKQVNLQTLELEDIPA